MYKNYKRCLEVFLQSDIKLQDKELVKYLIEKGADASIFFSAKAAQKKSTVPLWKVLILNLAVLLMGIGAGIFIGSILEAYTLIENGVAYAGSIFLFAGIGLFVG